MICACGHEHRNEGPCGLADGDGILLCSCPEYHETPQWHPTNINEQWSLVLPSHRCFRTNWDQWERDRLEHMHSLLQPGMVVYDIGAEEGDMPALWASWGCEVVLVEPGPRVWANMREVFNHNNLPIPLGCFEGFAAARDIPDPPRLRDGWPAAAFGPVVHDHGFRNLCERPDIPKAKLDTLAKRFGYPDALSIDVEGAEYDVLLGAERRLQHNLVPPLVWVAVHPEFMHRMYARTESDLNRLMLDCGYQGTLLQDSHEAHWFYWRPDVHKIDA